jgi:hypothetical protein
MNRQHLFRYFVAMDPPAEDINGSELVWVDYDPDNDVSSGMQLLWSGKDWRVLSTTINLGELSPKHAAAFEQYPYGAILGTRDGDEVRVVEYDEIKAISEPMAAV